MEDKAPDGANQETLAIVFGDLVGLDMLTAQLGDLQADLIRQRFFQRTHKLIQQHEGELVKTVGDGLLAVFPQAAHAVEFAIETQKALQDDQFGFQPGQLKCRFGIHFASVRTKRTAESLDIFGWEVTYAARLLQLQQTTDFLISEAAFQGLPSPLSAQFLKHREAEANPADGPGVWNYRGSLNEQKTSPARGGLPTHIGKYEILSVLGQGGMGIVYLARDRAIDLPVALKTLSSASTKARKRFLEEAQGSCIEHQNIVRVYEVGEHDAVPYIAMEFIRGEPLDRLLNSDRKLTLIEKLEIIGQVCDGLGYAHSKGIIHRDIKPGNIMVQPNGRVKIVDFTAVQSPEDCNLTGVTRLMATAHYISPERMKGQDSDGRADIWATGVMLYCLLTGKPFPETPNVLVFSEPYPPLSTHLKEYPAALDFVLERALAKEPSNRYSTATEFALDLLPIIEGLKREQTVRLRANMTERFNRTAEDVTLVSQSPPAAVPAPLLPPPSTAHLNKPTGSTQLLDLLVEASGQRRLRSIKSPRATTVFTSLASPAFKLDLSNIECASEAIAVIDIVQATATSDLFGWYAVGRVLIRELREYVREIGAKYDMCCIKSTGDGFLLTYRNEESAEVAAIHAVKASHELLTQLAARNQKSPEQRKIAVRLALHFGEVDILPDDRQGPNISYAFRVEAVSHASLPQAINPIDPGKFPVRDYIICSERVCEIVNRHLPHWNRTSCGLFKLKGFSGWGELFLISERADA